MEKTLDVLVKAMTNHSSAHVQQVTQVKVCAIFSHIDHTTKTCPMFSIVDQESSLINLSQHYHEQEPSSTYWPQQYQEEVCQSQFVANYNGQYMEEECTYYHVQTTTTRGNEENVEEMFSEASLEDPLEECFAQFEFDLDLDMKREQAKALFDSTPKNNKVEEEEEQTEVLEEPHREKEESTTKTSSISTLFLKYQEPKREVGWGYVMSKLRASR
jgi:hypothetical protein